AFRGETEINPHTDDFYRVLVEERQRLKRKPGITIEERWRAQGAKITNSSISYGVKMQIQRDDHAKLTAVDVYTGSNRFTTATSTPEQARSYCFPPLGAAITAGARLILTLVEREVRSLGGVLAYCDTDSALIVCTREGGLVPCPEGPERMPDG